MEFEWDDEKAKLNAQKHGVTFEEAELAFYDENAVILFDNANSAAEIRYQLVALSPNRLLFVSYTERFERIRIISARRANARHTRIYNEFNR